MKAVILAAGEGQRLSPLTNVRPKPMLPVANEPILARVIEAVAAAGIEEILLVVGYKSDRIQQAIGDGDDWGVDVTYVKQAKQLGTGDAVLQAEPHVEEDFLVLNGDRVTDSQVLTDVIERRKTTGETVMAVTRAEERSLYGVVELDGDRVIDIIEKPEPHEIDSDLINAGVYAFGPEIFEAIRATSTHGELALTDVLSTHLDARPIQAVPDRQQWFDVTRPWDLLTVNAALLEGEPVPDRASVDQTAALSAAVAVGSNAQVYPNATVLNGTAIGDNVTIGPNATVSNSILMADVTVEAGAVVRDAIVAENVTIGPNATIVGGKADVILQDSVHRDVTLGGVIGDNAVIGGAVTVHPGSFVGNGATVAHGAQIDGRIEPNGTVQ
ncbi:glucose-1-phosphate thymidylyltransferase [Halodesulfurarchaeum formicicum]|uniref:Bifunctional protein GlmU n=1 Tax=Halodesulfurarchaeum formicicum TaxID=1873524 RepID=A0A1D8S3Y7_9EURY|nr:sugar phosphate nucleotidyltransferase [Halodesulfurarchaeum formicicum]AOW80068.1 glucose-1-phosphate thymidylyltransferase [Halodesulfurarchaeum formicicum]